MVAFKTFSQLEESQRPVGIPAAWPWQEMNCTPEQSQALETQGYIVLSNEDYDSYKATHQSSFNAWMASNTLALTMSAIDAKILSYQLIAPKLLRELYVENTVGGISTVQSDQMFDDYFDILVRVREGAFPTALRRLQFKRPSGFVTQAIIDRWITKITSYL